MLTEEPTGSKGKKRAAPYPPEPPSTRPGFQPTQLGGTQTEGIPLERKGSLERLVDNTILHAQKSKIGKNSPAVNRRFEEGVAAINAQLGKTPIDQQAAAAFYANASAGGTRLPKALSEKFSADRDKLAKAALGPDATAAEYARAIRERLAKARFGPDATAGDYNRANNVKRAKAMFGPDATTADYSRANRERLAKAKLGPDATATDYNRSMLAAQAVRELGPRATVADLATLQTQELALAAQRGVRVEEIRGARKQGPASGESSFPGPNQR